MNMLRNLLLAGMLIAGLAACKNDNTTGNQNAVTAQGTSGYQGGPGSVVGPPMMPPQNAVTARLTKDYWVFEYYIAGGDRTASRANMGRWYKFNADGTFESGRWDDQVWGSGNWYYMQKEGKDVLRLDSNVDAEDAEWELQGSNDSAWSWSGNNNSYGNAGHILKALSLMTIPTREQFQFRE
jgi:hypothetical protein